MPEIGERRVRTATFVVAASDSMVQDKAMADYVCDGVNDHVEIQAALDALPATGGEVKLLDGAYYIGVSLVLDSYQTLKGAGRSTILTSSGGLASGITATGGPGTEKVGIVIADLCIDGNAGGSSITNLIVWSYVDDSKILNCWLQDCSQAIRIDYSDRDRIIGCHISGCSTRALNLQYCTYLKFDESTIVNSSEGAYIFNCSYFSSFDSLIDFNSGYGIDSLGSTDSAIIGSSFNGNLTGLTCILLDNNSDRAILDGNHIIGGKWGVEMDEAPNSIISNNIIRGNRRDGIYASSSNNCSFLNNIIFENSQETDNSYSGISLYDCDDCKIAENIIRRGALTNHHQYGINISHSSCDRCVISDNDLYDSGDTANFRNVGTLTTVGTDNKGIQITDIKEYSYVKNTSGGARAVGDVVSLKSVAAGNEVTAPTADGERQVYGMVAETINDNAWGFVQVKGKTTALKATNVGGGNIVIGDFLITENGVRARKATAATDPIFARALEALAAADGVIDAYIVSPWH